MTLVRQPDLGTFDPARIADVRRQLRSAVLWPARIAASYAQDAIDRGAPLLTWDQSRQAVTTPAFGPGLQLELRLPDLHMQFLDHGRPVPHVLDLDDRSPAHVEAWLLVELLHRDIDRERFSKKLPFDIQDAMSGDDEKFATIDYPAELAALTDWLVMASGVLGELSHGAPVSVMPQSVSLATTMRLRSGGGEAGESRRVVFSLGDATSPEPNFTVVRETQGTVTPLRPDTVLSASMLRRLALSPAAIARSLESGSDALGAA